MKKVFLMMVLGLLTIHTKAQGQPEEKRMAVVDYSTIYMRIAPDYESALETQELMGTIVEITGEKGYWREIISPQPYKAWCTELSLAEMSAEELEAYKAAPKYIYTELYGHIYSTPSLKSQTICDLVAGDILRQGDRKGKWAQVILPSGRKGWVLAKEVEDAAERQKRMDKIRTEDPLLYTENIISFAHKLLGVPYLWGGMSSKGVDCSGLVRISCLMNGYLLPRNASQIIHTGEVVPMEVETGFWEDRSDKEGFKAEMLQRVKNLRRGDLVFFGTPGKEGKPRITHIGIYLGDNKIIHSSHEVRINSLIPGDYDFYENSHRLIAARRMDF